MNGKCSIACFVLLLAPAGAQAQSTTAWTCSPAQQLVLPGTVSVDGRYITYCVEDTVTTAPSWGPNRLVLRDTWQPGTPDIVLGSSIQNIWHAASWNPCATPDGGLIVFTDITSHDGADFNSTPDVYLYDRVAGTYELISVNANGTGGNGVSVTPGSISDDGRYVVFSTMATDIAPGNSPSWMDVVVRDRILGTTTLVSSGSSGAAQGGHSFAGVISGDGRFVAFESNASNLVSLGSSPWCNVYLHDLVGGRTKCVSLNTSGSFGTGESGTGNSFWDPIPSVLPGTPYLIPAPPGISSDGRFVSFASKAPDLVPNDTNTYWDVFVRDTVAGSTTRVSVGPNGAQAGEHSGGASISADGRFVGFFSRALDLGPAHAGGLCQVYVHDRVWLQNEVASVDSQGVPQFNFAAAVVMSDTGRFTLFSANSPNGLTPPCGLAGNGRLYLRDRGVTHQRSFCPDGGAGSVCPCGPSLGTLPSEAGCTHSHGGRGMLTAAGDASLSADTLVLHGSQMTNSAVLYFQGTATVAGGAGAPFGDGVRCVAGQIRRLSIQQNVLGSSSYPNPGQPLLSVIGQVSSSGPRYYQGWFRDPAPVFCTSATFNLTNGREVVWVP